MKPAAPILIVDGREYAAWQRASVSKSLDEFAHSWSVEYVDRWVAGAQPWSILPGAACQFLADTSVVVSGFVTRSVWNTNATDYTVTAEGRSATGDLVDSAPLTTLPSAQLNDLNPLQIIQAICKPFAISVIDEVGDTRAVRKFTLELGETCFDAIDRLCRNRGILPVTTSEGFLALTRSENFTREVTLDADLVETRGLEYSEAERHSEYFVYGQHGGEEQFRAEKILAQAGSDFDGVVARHRPLVVLSESPSTKEDLDAQAVWERNVRAGRSEVVRYRVPGIFAPDGAPWEPGMLVRVADPVIRVNSTLLVNRVNHNWEADAQWTDIALTRKEAYSTKPVPSQASTGIS